MSPVSVASATRTRVAHQRPAPAPAAEPAPASLQAWVADMVELLQPDDVVWCDGSSEERERLTRQLVDAGTLLPLDPDKRPGSYLARTDPSDVARVEGRTFIASASPDDAGPLNNWREPDALRAELQEVMAGAMRGRTLYVVPFSMGPVGGPLSALGVELTDSAYVVVSMHLMTRVGADVRALIDAGAPWVPAVHTVGAPLVVTGPDGVESRRPDVPWPCNETKYIAHFPETREIWSYGSGYGGNALLGKKCFALRIASAIARDEGWLAEHMLVVRVTDPQGRTAHIAAAFPSACGKTNFAMMQPTLPGWRVETIGDDIAWLRPDAQGRLRALNPEAGFFGVAPGTGHATNPVAMATLARDVIFTNVALTDDGDVWWEGMTDEPPAHAVDWRGQDWTPDSGRPAAHPNARFTVAASQCPSMADSWQDPEGVVLDAIVFGGRRRTTVPLVTQAEDWTAGVLMGATVASEMTAAAEGTVGTVRRDPFAMAPFTGYHVADHWQHWLDVGERLSPEGRPQVFTVNWFRRDDQGRFLWPGFGDNSRVLAWIVGRVTGEARAVSSPIGLHPSASDLDLRGLDLAPGALQELLDVPVTDWLHETEQVQEFTATLDDRTPPALLARLAQRRWRLAALQRQ